MPDGKQAASVWVRLVKCHDLVMREVRQRVSQGDTTLPQFDVLAQLYRHPQGVTATELSRALLVTAGNLTGIIDRLEARGLVTRTPQAHDRRVRLLKLTAAGRRLATREVARHEQWLAQIFSGLEATEQQALVRALDALRHSLDQTETP